MFPPHNKDFAWKGEINSARNLSAVRIEPRTSFDLLKFCFGLFNRIPMLFLCVACMVKVDSRNSLEALI